MEPEHNSEYRKNHTIVEKTKIKNKYFKEKQL